MLSPVFLDFDKEGSGANEDVEERGKSVEVNEANEDVEERGESEANVETSAVCEESQFGCCPGSLLPQHGQVGWKVSFVFYEVVNLF